MKRIAGIAFLTTLLHSDFTLVYEVDGGEEGKLEEVIEYKDAHNIKLSFHKAGMPNHSEAEGLYIIDGVRYSVVKENGKLIYFNMDKLDEVAGKMANESQMAMLQEGNSANEKPFFTPIKKGATKVIGGIKGEVWDVESSEDGEVFREQIVVTKEREIVEAVLISLEVLKQFGEAPNGREFDHNLETMFHVDDSHVLLWAEDTQFKSFSKESIDAKVFRLPKDAVDGIDSISKLVNM